MFTHIRFSKLFGTIVFMVDINKHTLYCDGKNYVISKSLNKAIANENTDNRLKTDIVDKMMRAAQTQGDKAAGQAFTQRNAQPALPQPLQRFVNVLTQFVAQTVQFARNINQQLQQLPVLLANVAQNFARGAGNAFQQMSGAILGLFFGFKKENDKTEEREQRDDNDFVGSDLFTTEKINESEQAGLGKGDS